ncbi:hypothetical protein HX857_34065, partial [Pseudomonas gingeri]|uniref:hypothetical protein n=1 Tax=Pseudomonas gingeri TaxID=117681 RepID=UPI0015C1B7BE
DCAPRLLLTHATALESLAAAPTALELAVLDLRDESAWADCPTDNPLAETLGLHDRHLAYVIYTSG